MKRLIEFLKQSSLDQKKYYGSAAILSAVLFVYAISHVADRAVLNIEQSKNADFKNGNLTTDESSDFYREKNQRAQIQNEKIIQRLKDVDEKMSELSKRFEVKDAPSPQGKADPPRDPAQAPAVSETEAGKKLIRRG